MLHGALPQTHLGQMPSFWSWLDMLDPLNSLSRIKDDIPAPLAGDRISEGLPRWLPVPAGLAFNLHRFTRHKGSP
jgi:hypothetical protein